MAAPVSHRSRITLTPRALRSAVASRPANMAPASAFSAAAVALGIDAVQAGEATSGTPSRRPPEDASLYRVALRPPAKQDERNADAASTPLADGSTRPAAHGPAPPPRDALRRYADAPTLPAGLPAVRRTA